MNVLHKINATRALSAIISLSLLGGCAEFHEKYEPVKEGWARQKGDKSLTIEGYKLVKGSKSHCFTEGFKVVLLPNDDYAKKYAKFLIQHDKNPLSKSISPTANALIRYTDWNRNCVYHFSNLPAGNWIVLFEIHNRLMPLITVATDKGPATRNTISSGDSYLWASFEIKPTDHDLKKKLVLNFPSPQPADPALNFQWGDNVSVHRGQLADWNTLQSQD